MKKWQAEEEVGGINMKEWIGSTFSMSLRVEEGKNARVPVVPQQPNG